MDTIDTTKLGGWAISIDAVDYMMRHVQRDKHVLMLGAGSSLPELRKVWTTHCIEHNPDFAERYNATLVPMVGRWYDPQAVAGIVRDMDPKPYCCVIDGPPGYMSLRSMAFDVLVSADFEPVKVFVVDDVQRQDESVLAMRLLRRLDRKAKTRHAVINGSDGTQTAFIIRD